MRLEAEVDGEAHVVEIDDVGGRPALRLDGQAIDVDARAMDGFFISMLVSGRAHEVTVEPDLPAGPGEESWRVQVGIEAHRVSFIDPLRPMRGNGKGGADPTGRRTARITSMMPGKVVRVLVKEGDAVVEGQDLVVIEAMKMENAVASTAAGRVVELKATVGDAVETGALLAVIG